MLAKHVFCYLHFCSYVYPNRLHFLLRVLLPFKFMAKITYPLLKQALEKQPIKIRPKQDSLFANQVYRLLETKTAMTSGRTLTKLGASRLFLALLGINLSCQKSNQQSQTVGCGFGSNTRDKGYCPF